MNAISFLARLVRDLNVSSPNDLTADARLEILDATNGAIQQIDSLSGSKSKTTVGSFFLAAPRALVFDVTNGSVEIAGNNFPVTDYAKTIRIEGDDIDNQITGGNTLLHPYTGATATVGATIYSDSLLLPEPYLEIISDPVILGEGKEITQSRLRGSRFKKKDTGRPKIYWMEGNAGNRNSTTPAVIRFHPMPEKTYRFEADVSLAPTRIKFADLLTTGTKLPVREEWVESYLLPVARGILTTSELWRDKQTKASAVTASDKAIAKFRALSPSDTYATPSNEVGTPYGF